MRRFTTYDKATISVFFNNEIPKRFYIFDSNDDIFYYRDLTPNNKTIKVNIAKADTFSINADAEIKIGPLEVKTIQKEMPRFEKNFYHKNFVYSYNPNLKGTPARNFYKKGIIEIGPRFYELPKPIRVFILCHEIGHSFYHDEHKADLFAVQLYLKKGYNKTMALHSLTDVLNYDSERNRERIQKLIKFMR